uniref:enoyl-CoA hydratase/isomerase family protein n=1 Tax=Castellaniella defragrans TaxID=75697 RepID=UPI0033411705
MKQQYGKAVTLNIDGAVALLRFDRGVNRNAIDQDTLLALTDAVRDLGDDLAVQAVVVAGGKDIFSAGIDLKDPAKWQEGDMSLLQRRNVAQRGARLCQAIENLPQITIAAIEGMAVGGSAALALACDWRVAAYSAAVYLPEVKVGLNMGWGAIPRLTTLIGPARAKRAIILGEKLDALTAESWGLFDHLSETGRAVDAALALARQTVQTPPALLRMSKEAVNASATALHRMAIYMDADQALVCRDSQEGQSARQRFSKG